MRMERKLQQNHDRIIRSKGRELRKIIKFKVHYLQKWPCSKTIVSNKAGQRLQGQVWKTGRYQAEDWQQWGTFPLSWFLKKNHQSTQLGKLNIVLAGANKSVIGSQDIPAAHYATEHLTRKFEAAEVTLTWILCCTTHQKRGNPSTTFNICFANRISPLQQDQGYFVRIKKMKACPQCV